MNAPHNECTALKGSSIKYTNGYTKYAIWRTLPESMLAWSQHGHVLRNEKQKAFYLVKHVVKELAHDIGVSIALLHGKIGNKCVSMCFI